MVRGLSIPVVEPLAMHQRIMASRVSLQHHIRDGAHTAGSCSGLINSYIKAGHAPAPWKAVMALAASHAARAAPMQAVTEISLRILLMIGLLTRPAAFVTFLYLGSLWVSE